MRMTTGDDRSELERELELYLERELEAGVLLTIRVLNTEKVDTTVTFRDDGNGAAQHHQIAMCEVDGTGGVQGEDEA